MLTIIYRLAAIIEAETDLCDCDPQIELPTAEADPQLARAVRAFDRVATLFASRRATTSDHGAGTHDD